MYVYVVSIFFVDVFCVLGFKQGNKNENKVFVIRLLLFVSFRDRFVVSVVQYYFCYNRGVYNMLRKIGE